MKRDILLKLILLTVVAAVFSISISAQVKQTVELVVETGHPEAVRSVAFSPNGKTLISGSNDNTVKLWDITSGIELKTLSGHSDSVLSVAFSPDGKTVASGSSDKTVKLWDSASGKEGITLFGRSTTGTFYLDGHSKAISSVTFSPDGKTLASGSFDHTIKLWDIRSGSVLRTLSGHPEYITSVAFSPDGKTLASGSHDKTVKLWDVASGKELRILPGHSKDVRSVAFSPDGKTLASGSYDDTIKLWDVASGKELRILPVNAGTVESVAFSPDGKTLALAGWDKIIKLWSVETGKELTAFSGHTSLVNSVRFSPDGKTLASGSSDHTVKLWTISSGKELRTLSGHSTQVSSVTFSPDGKTLASDGYSDKTIKLWDIASGVELKTLSGHSDSVLSVAFSPDSKTLASGSGDKDKTVRLWDVRTGKELRILPGHADRVESVAFSPEGKTLASADWDNIFKLWEVETGRELKTGSLFDVAVLKEIRKSFPGFIEKHFEWLSGKPKRADSNSLIAKITDNSRIKLSDKITGKELATLIAVDKNDWVVTTPEGRFDTSKSLDRIEGLHWVVNDEISNPLPLDIFMRQYYEPKLLQRVLAGEQFKTLPSIADINRVQPKVEIIGEPKLTASEPGMIEVTVGVEKARGAQWRNGRSIELETGVYDLRLFRDGQLVGYEPTQAGVLNERVANSRKVLSETEDEAQWRRATEVKLDKDGRATRTFKVRLPRGTDAKQIELSAYAFNVDLVRSRTAIRTIDNPVAASTIKRRAYIIAVGVNANENETWDLSFAANDARRIERNMRDQLARTRQYAPEDIVTVSLISDYEKLADGRKALPRRVNENYATKRNFQTLLELLAGKQVNPALIRQLPDYEKLKSTLRQARPEDLVLISFSSHGYADAQGNFYLVPYDMGKSGSADLAAQDVLRRSISSAELSRWLRDVDAGELTMIVDACHAAASVQTAGFKPGPMASRGLGQLAYDKGMRILTSTQAGDKAWEADALSDISNAAKTSAGDDKSGGGGNGLLTYVLTRDGLETFKADANLDGSITLSEWLTYGVEGVPMLAQALQKRIDDLNAPNLKSISLGSGTAARVIVLNRNDNSVPTTSELQQLPSLFDFARRRRDPIIAVGN